MKTLEQFLNKFSVMVDGYIGSYSEFNGTIEVNWYDDDGELYNIVVPSNLVVVVDENGVCDIVGDDGDYQFRFYTEVPATNDWD